jgi:hypothetical protein
MLVPLSWLSGPSRSCSTRCALRIHLLRNCRQKTVRKLVQPNLTTACPNISVSKSQYPRSLVPGAFDSLRKPLEGIRSKTGSQGAGSVPWAGLMA